MNSDNTRRIRSVLLMILIFGIISAFIIFKISILISPVPTEAIDYSLFPWYEIPIVYLWNYIKNAGLSLLFAFFLGGLIQEYLPADIITKYLGSKKFRDYVIAAALAPIFITCSCSVIPIYVSLLLKTDDNKTGTARSGASPGAAMTFFLMAPAASLLTILLTGEYLGWDLGLFRLIFSFIAAIACGYIFDRTSLAKELEQQYATIQAGRPKRMLAEKTFDDRIENVFRNVWFLMKKILVYLVIGIVVVSYIAAYLPEEWITNYFTGFWGIILGALLGGPIYTPVLVEIVLTRSLLTKGMSRSTALAFMMGQPYDIVSWVPNSKFFKWRGVFLYSCIFFVFSIIAALVYVLFFGW
jgi:uncharacterized membrane protein YraQ (UPF0718 family)